MGFLKFLSPVASLFGGGDEGSSSPAPAAQAAPEEDTGKTTEQLQKEQRQKLVAANAGKDATYNPLSNDAKTVTSKTLLGL